jgi:hypothetical protein
MNLIPERTMSGARPPVFETLAGHVLGVIGHALEHVLHLSGAQISGADCESAKDVARRIATATRQNLFISAFIETPAVRELDRTAVHGGGNPQTVPF